MPFSRLPEWPDAMARVLAAPAIGAAFAEFRIDLDEGQRGDHVADVEVEHFIYLLKGEAYVELSSERTGVSVHKMHAGVYALLPPDCSYALRARTKSLTASASQKE